MIRISLYAATGVILSVLAASRAQAATANQAVTAQFTINNSCTLSTPQNMDFGTLPATLNVQATTATGKITVTCTTGATWQLSGDTGGNAVTNSGTTTPRMLGFSPSGIGSRFYYLSYDTAWDSGMTRLTHSVASTGTGTGASQTVTVYGRIGAQTATGPGNYGDAMTFTISY
ncbi:hypothetical protein BSZ14_05105 [Sphingomonas sp. Sph1(2015)]|jgi:spore coat protein U-like protein|uniref:spore coat protein U domain-containing protein n=1 Tax=Sphingomonas TaxID=13687 RepID=UPI0009776131|nr:spore coat protein U domain-containing protein [Sphingomonas sp. Sph1(2015)]OMJ32985.1 hypothetical protein BSZ14_05105 [Sphingomonas sp. Sph1(2015)]